LTKLTDVPDPLVATLLDQVSGDLICCAPFEMPLNPQLERIESTESLQGLLENSSFEAAILDTGFRKPLSSLTVEDVPVLQGTLKAQVILKVKPELDQFCEGLETCGVLHAVTKYPSLMAPYFLWTDVDLTPGACAHMCQ